MSKKFDVSRLPSHLTNNFAISNSLFDSLSKGLTGSLLRWLSLSLLIIAAVKYLPVFMIDLTTSTILTSPPVNLNNYQLPREYTEAHKILPRRQKKLVF